MDWWILVPMALLIFGVWGAICALFVRFVHNGTKTPTPKVYSLDKRREYLAAQRRRTFWVVPENTETRFRRVMEAAAAQEAHIRTLENLRATREQLWEEEFRPHAKLHDDVIRIGRVQAECDDCYRAGYHERYCEYYKPNRPFDWERD